MENNQNVMSQQTAEETVNNDVVISEETNAVIKAKIKELQESRKIKHVFAIVVEGEEGDEKPLYIGYFRRPSLAHFSQYMSFVQKDIVQAAKMLASNTFVDGDRSLVDDDDLFIYGTFQKLTTLMENRNATLVKA